MSKRPIRYSTLALGTALALGCLRSAQPTSAQDVVDRAPQIETTYREVRDGDVVRRIPTSQYVYRTYRSTTDERRSDLPHSQEIASLVRKLLAAKSHYGESAGQIGTDDTRKLSSELEEMIGGQFDAMHQHQQKQIDELAERLQALKVQHEKRSAARDEIVQRRLNELLRQPDPLAWNPQPEHQRNAEYLPMSGTPKRNLGPPAPLGRTGVPIPPQPAQPPQPQLRSGIHFRPAVPVQPLAPSKNTITLLRSANLSDHNAVQKATEDLYAAIGRASIEKNSSAARKLQESIEHAKRVLNQSSSKITYYEGFANAPNKEAFEQRIQQLNQIIKEAKQKAGQNPGTVHADDDTSDKAKDPATTRRAPSPKDRREDPTLDTDRRKDKRRDSSDLDRDSDSRDRDSDTRDRDSDTRDRDSDTRDRDSDTRDRDSDTRDRDSINQGRKDQDKRSTDKQERR